MADKRQYDPETKAAAMAALLTGQSISAVADEYKIPRGTVASWRRVAKTAPMYEADQPQKREVGDLLLDYLRANLQALRAQAEVFSDRHWLAQQDASELAVLHGVMTDKAIRLMEAFGRASDSDTVADD